LARSTHKQARALMLNNAGEANKRMGLLQILAIKKFST
jgi:hypothetical protein